MTRISSASPSPNSLLDQIGSQAGASKDSGNTAAFNSHLARFGRDANGEPPATDANQPASTTDTSDAQTSGKDQQDSVSALFAALSGDTQATDAPGNSQTKGSNADFNSQLARFTNGGASGASATETPNAASSTAQSGDPSGKGQGQSVTALFAALTSDAQSNAPAPAATAAGQTSAQADANANMNQAAGAGQFPQPPAASANNAASGTASQIQMQSKAPVKDALVSSTPAKPASKNTDGSNSKADDQPATTAPDPTASAQSAAGVMAASLTTQNTIATQASRKLGSTPGAGSNVFPTRMQPGSTASAHMAGPDAASASGLQSPSAVSSAAQTNAFDPFADLADADGSSSPTIKMKLTSIQAETHFAPVQHLSPTMQIAEFIASSGGNMASAESPDDASSTTASGQTPAATPSLTQPQTSMIKTLTLSLEPDSLGTVTVTMKLGDSGLDLQVEAAKSDTTSLLDKDKGSLADRLQSLGYTVDSLVVKTAAGQATHQDPSNDQSAAGQGQQQAGQDASASGLSQNGGRNANDQSAAQRARETAAGLGQENSSDPSAARTVGDGVYV